LVLPKKTNGDLDNSWKKNSFYLTIMDISSIIFGKADLIIVGSLLSVTELAIYGIVMKIIDLFLKMIKSSVESILPRIYGDPNLKLKSFYRPFLLCVIISIFLSLLIGFSIYFSMELVFLRQILLSEFIFFS
jgi:O-antigen/teichoic acid export membrane protein